MFYPHTIKGKTNLRLDLIALPQNLTPPSLVGDLGIDDLLTVTQGVWFGTGSFSYVYQWLRDGILIAGETGTTYTTVIADDGAEITAKEFATDDAGTQSEVSNGLDIADGPVCAFLDSFLFNAAADKVSVPVVAANNLQGDYTWACWVYTGVNVSQYMLYAHDGAASVRGSYMGLIGSKVQATVFPTAGSNAGVVTIDSATIVFNTWYLAIARLDTSAQTLSMTLNGVTTSIACTVTNDDASPYAWAIGARSGTPNHNLTMPMIFNRTLTDPECAILLGAGSPVYFETLPSSITDDCVGAWELSSRDNSCVDLTGTSNGTAENGVTSDGQSVEFCPE